MKTSEILKKIPTSTSEFGKAMESNFAKWMRGKFGDRSYQIYPSVFQNSDSFRDFRFRLFKELNSMTPLDVEWSSSTSLLGEMGQAASHILLPFENSDLIRKDMGLREIAKDELELYSNLLDKIISNSTWDSFSVKDKSSSGFPHFIKGVGFKLSEVNRVFKRLDKILEASHNHDMASMVAIMQNYPLFTLGVRYQLDDIIHENGVSRNAKKRFAYSPEYIKTDGKKGEKIEIDFSVYSSTFGRDYRFCAARVRSMYALSYSYNCILQALNNFLVNGLKKTCPEVLFTTPEAALTLLNEKGVVDKICIDYSQYGETMPGVLVEILCKKLNNVRKGLGDFLRITYNAPKLIRGWRKEENSPFMNVDEIDYHSEITSSLASGHGLVAFLGKLFAVFDGILVFRKLIPNFDVDMHLHNKYASYTRLSSSDDGIIAFHDSNLFHAYEKNYQKFSIFKISITSSPVYLGNIYLKNRVTRDIKKLLERLTNFERGMNSKMFFELGIGASINEYRTNTYFSDVFPVLVKYFFRELGIDLKQYVDKAEDLAQPTAIFLANPDSIFYKLDPALVNSVIYKRYFANVSKENVEFYFGAA